MLIWKIELEALAALCSELCGVQYIKEWRREERLRGLQGLVMSEVLVDQIKMSCLVRKLTGYITYTSIHNTLTSQRTNQFSLSLQSRFKDEGKR